MDRQTDRQTNKHINNLYHATRVAYALHGKCKNELNFKVTESQIFTVDL